MKKTLEYCISERAAGGWAARRPCSADSPRIARPPPSNGPRASEAAPVLADSQEGASLCGPQITAPRSPLLQAGAQGSPRATCGPSRWCWRVSPHLAPGCSTASTCGTRGVKGRGAGPALSVRIVWNMSSLMSSVALCYEPESHGRSGRGLAGAPRPVPAVPGGARKPAIHPLEPGRRSGAGTARGLSRAERPHAGPPCWRQQVEEDVRRIVGPAAPWEAQGGSPILSCTPSAHPAHALPAPQAPQAKHTSSGESGCRPGRGATLCPPQDGCPGPGRAGWGPPVARPPVITCRSLLPSKVARRVLGATRLRTDRRTDAVSNV